MTEDREYFESKGFQEILKQYEESAKSGYAIYMDGDDLADIADYYQLQGRTEEADAVINLALAYNPEAVGPLLTRHRLWPQTLRNCGNRPVATHCHWAENRACG